MAMQINPSKKKKSLAKKQNREGGATQWIPKSHVGFDLPAYGTGNL